MFDRNKKNKVHLLIKSNLGVQNKCELMILQCRLSCRVACWHANTVTESQLGSVMRLIRTVNKRKAEPLIKIKAFYPTRFNPNRFEMFGENSRLSSGSKAGQRLGSGVSFGSGELRELL